MGIIAEPTPGIVLDQPLGLPGSLLGIRQAPVSVVAVPGRAGTDDWCVLESSEF